MEERRCVVQFIHPGGEHQPDDGTRKSWNTGAHKRKFLTTRGRIAGTAGLIDIAFWGEWEPESEIVELIRNPAEHGPRYVWRPYYRLPTHCAGLQNTDPFVFGGFYYSICRQLKAGRPTQLRKLAPGSVILFGSHKAGDFVLDTVFVVRDYVDHDQWNYRDRIRRVPKDYVSVALSPFYENLALTSGCGPSGGQGGVSLRLYFGATVDNPIDGMFSYFPCCRYVPGSRGFARPKIRLRGFVSRKARQVGLLTRDTNATVCKQVWKTVRAQIQAGCRVGVYAAFPTRR